MKEIECFQSIQTPSRHADGQNHARRDEIPERSDATAQDKDIASCLGYHPPML